MNYFKKSFRYFLFVVAVSSLHSGFAQPGYWQQRVKYVMDIDMNVATNRFTGKQHARLYQSFTGYT